MLDPHHDVHQPHRALLLTLDRVVPHLVRRGLLPPEAVVHGRVEVEDRSRRNRNFKVIVPGGRSLLVKQTGRLHDERWRRTLRQEADVLRALDIPRDVPGVVDEDREGGVLVTELVHPATTLTKYHLHGGSPIFPEDAARDAGRLLRRVHEAGERARSRGLALPDAPPLAWSLPREPPEGASRVERAFLTLLPREYEACAASATAGWRASASFVHGDVRWDNVLVAAGERDGGLDLRLVDWEIAALGDPAWDVACYLGEHLRFWLTTAMLLRARDLADARAKAAVPLDAFAAPARAFLRAYGGGPDLARRAASLLPLHLVLVGYELTQRQTELLGVSRAALELAFDPTAREALGL